MRALLVLLLIVFAGCTDAPGEEGSCPQWNEPPTGQTFAGRRFLHNENFSTEPTKTDDLSGAVQRNGEPLVRYDVDLTLELVDQEVEIEAFRDGTRLDWVPLAPGSERTARLTFEEGAHHGVYHIDLGGATGDVTLRWTAEQDLDGQRQTDSYTDLFVRIKPLYLASHCVT